jgi:hypothetical protein
MTDGTVSTSVATTKGSSPHLNTVSGLALAAMAIAIQLSVALWSMSVSTQVVLGAAAAVLTCLGGLVVVSGLDHNVKAIAHWRLGPWYLIWGAFAFGLASLTWVSPQVGTSSQIAPESVVYALKVFIAATIVWTAGYVAGIPTLVRRNAGRAVGLITRGTTSVICGPGIPWMMYGIGSLARLVTIVLTNRLGFVGDATGLVSQARPYSLALDAVAMLTVFAIAAAAYRAFIPTIPGGKATLWTLAGIEVVVGALAGGKQSFVVAVLAVVIPYGAIRGRLAMRILLPGSLAFLFLILPFNGAYRQVVRHGSEASTLSPTDATAAAPGILSQTTSGDSPLTVFSDSATVLLYRVRLIDSLAIITQRAPSMIPYSDPLEFATAPFVGLIPRVVWPNKPVLATGYQFSQDYYGLPASMLSASSITPVGDLYRHGGSVVAIVGMFVIGIACRLFDTLFRPEKDPRAVCFLLVFLPTMVKSEVDLYALIVNVPAGLLTAALGAQLICKRRSAGLTQPTVRNDLSLDPPTNFAADAVDRG